MTFLRSRVARRMFMLFVACALLPIVALTAVSFHQVAEQFRDDNREHLMQASKAEGMAILERLQMLDAELHLLAVQAKGRDSLELTKELQDRFRFVTVLRDSRDRRLAATLANLEPDQEQHLLAAKTLVRLQACSGQAKMCVVMMRWVDSSRRAAGLLLAEVNPDYLWDSDDLPSGMEQCAFDSKASPLVCPNGNASPLGDSIQSAGRLSGFLSWRANSKRYDAGYWTLLLKPQFQAASWTIVVSVDHAQTLATLRHFGKSFPLVVLLSLWIVILASMVQIRRTLVPLEKLKEGTQKIGEQNFSARVDLHSGDEFEALAGSFNSMALRLGRQFHALKTIRHIDEAILASLNREGIVEAVLVHMHDLLPCDCCGITLFGSEAQPVVLTRLTKNPATRLDQDIVLRTEASIGDLQLMQEHPEVLVISEGEPIPDFIAPLRKTGLTSFLIFPVFLEHNAFGALLCADRGPLRSCPQDLQQVRQVADQLAVAFSNVQLIEALEQLHWGTLTALARAIDAKSAWTAGHSERVTNLSLRIGKAMGLSAKDLKIMHRGGLLHDIGKIGTPPSILDKPDKLDTEETRIMQDHVRVGLRILEPIPGLAEALSIVAQHHEWFNGSGYPKGLAGEQISLHARIFAVADCYDAMISDRPYRLGMPQERVLEILQQKAGAQFDPKVIKAFLRLCVEDERANEERSGGVAGVQLVAHGERDVEV